MLHHPSHTAALIQTISQQQSTMNGIHVLRDTNNLLEVLFANRRVKTFTEDIDHITEIFIVPHKRKPDITCPAEHLRGKRQRILSRSKSPVDKISGIGLVSKQFNREAMSSGLIEELLYLFISEVV
mmetsp:Transcript_36731/g.64375  ORF Transcript_36731/g.64375 Transcript_36731/m.64375 type:complete len:126 (+) Transcript_36731:230-607(+)